MFESITNFLTHKICFQSTHKVRHLKEAASMEELAQSQN